MKHVRSDSDLSNFLATAGRDASGGESVIKRALQVIRRHLGLQVAYVSEFVGEDSVFREVDAPGLEELIKPGDSRPLDDVYCRHILAGRLPELMPDTSREPVAVAMPITSAVPIGAHVSVPVKLSDGTTYGMFCCLGPTADPSLNPRDLQMMRAFAELAAFEIDRDRQENEIAETRIAQVRSLIDDDKLEIVHQPICCADDRRVLGVECLSRFSAEPARPPDIWFAEADAAGLRTELEVVALRKAVATLDALPPDIYLSINASPKTILSEEFHAALDGVDGSRFVIELTENATVEDYSTLLETLKPLRARGFRLAVDDAGAGYSSMQHILQLYPDIIKLDMQLTRGIDVDLGRRALAFALITFSHDIGSKIVAEGVETEGEFEVLRNLGVDAVQGYLTGRPCPPDPRPGKPAAVAAASPPIENPAIRQVA